MDELTGAGLDGADLEAVDALAEGYQQRGAQPGLAYGVVAGGRLVHAGGLGERRIGGPRPDAGTVFRIASMTKSFTATMVLALRDDGALSLDDLAERYVPELRGWPPVTPDAQRVRIRHLLTMTAGFPTDDPWGDREQGTPLPEFAAFLAQGVSFNWAPGTRFEYSNLGYAILGRVISAVTGLPYPESIEGRILGPLGLTQSGYEAASVDPDALAAGHRRDGDGWEEVPMAPSGAFAPMGGVFSSVHDLARWVAGFAA
ncbi:MAG TPA: serine hydrolase domain-containing protein, partial [Streptosporangiaceae bacterium]|nr:serine hydrolase domain-containing protein [Streptosporangiaceae bacterium]